MSLGSSPVLQLTSPCLSVFAFVLWVIAGTSTGMFNSWLGAVVRAKGAVFQKLSPLQLFSWIKEKKSLPVYVLRAAKVALASVKPAAVVWRSLVFTGGCIYSTSRASPMNFSFLPQWSCSLPNKCQNLHVTARASCYFRFCLPISRFLFFLPPFSGLSVIVRSAKGLLCLSRGFVSLWAGELMPFWSLLSPV